MKTIQEINRARIKGDIALVADLADISPETVKKVLSGDRADLHDIQRIFSEIIVSREQVAARVSKRSTKRKRATA